MSITGKKREFGGPCTKKNPAVAEVCLIFNYLSVWPFLKGESTPDVVGRWSKNLLEVNNDIHYEIKLLSFLPGNKVLWLLMLFE